jgi:excisionase family DNA binding protein
MATSVPRIRRATDIDPLTLLDGESMSRPSGILREPLLDAQQAATLLGIPRSSVYDYAKRGELPHVRVGRHVKFIRSDLEGAIAERRMGV